ncbi:hypothetical protein ID866_10348, partial [Astraeus odoratus]
MKHAVMHPPAQISDRSKLRMERLRQMELEQQQWEQEALVLPEVCAACAPCVSHAEPHSTGPGFGQALVPLVRAYEEPTPKPPCTELGDFHVAPESTTWSTQPPSRSELALRAPEDTVRAPRAKAPARPPLHPANQFFGLSASDKPIPMGAHQN